MFIQDSGIGVDLPVFDSLSWLLYSHLLDGRFCQMYVDILNAEITRRIYMCDDHNGTNAKLSHSMPRLSSRAFSME